MFKTNYCTLIDTKENLLVIVNYSELGTQVWICCYFIANYYSIQNIIPTKIYANFSICISIQINL